ncbi:hypothetical protein QBC45DRAFT_418160 [Copromyces sp. CBS 386.78]|nr:hypothetical protein QBC45DRAFT_418160 [Copromyces sp. CBS 386.78]
MGMVHVEGWGRGIRHLMRPDQMVNWEAYKRGLPLHLRAERMMLYGHVDFNTGRPLVPSLDELYMSDDEFDLPADSSWGIMKHRKAQGGCGNVPFERGMWQPKHARKARWKTLTEEEKEDILAAEEEEIKEEKKLRYVEGDLDVALADLEEALYDYAVEKEEGSHEEYGIDGLEFDSRVPMPDDTFPSDEEEDFDDDDWEACAKYMEGLGPDRPVPDQLTLIRQDKARGQLGKSLLMAKQVFDSMAESNDEKQEQDKAWSQVAADKLHKIAGKDPAHRRCVPVAPRNPTPAAYQAFLMAHDGRRHAWVVPVHPEQAELPEVRAEYLLKAAVSLNRAKLDTGDLDPSADAMPDDEVAELEDEQITAQLEETVNHGWMLHMRRSEGGGGGLNGQAHHSVQEPPIEMPVPLGMDMDIEEDREAWQEMKDMEDAEDMKDEEDEEDEEDTDEDTEDTDDTEEEDHGADPVDDFSDLITTDFTFIHTPMTPNFSFHSPPNFGGLHNPNPTNAAGPSTIPPSPYFTPNNTINQPIPNITINQSNPHNLNSHNQPNIALNVPNRPTPNPAPNPHNPDLPYPSETYHYHCDPDHEFDWRGWLDMQHQNDLLSEAARLDPDLLDNAHEIGPEELKKRVEKTIEATKGYKDWRERELRRWYRQW